MYGGKQTGSKYIPIDRDYMDRNFIILRSRMRHFVFDLDDTLILHKGQVNYNWIYEDIELTYHLDECQGKRYVFTNGNAYHASEILTRMNIRDKFERVFTREDFGFKPDLRVFQHVDHAIRGEDKTQAVIFFDDMSTNLRSAKSIGWSTCWIHPYYESRVFSDHIDDGYQDIKQGLKYINKELKYNIHQSYLK